MLMIYVAAYWLSRDKQTEVVLTRPEDSDKSDDELLDLALEEAEKTGLEIGCGKIVIGPWTR